MSTSASKVYQAAGSTTRGRPARSRLVAVLSATAAATAVWLIVDPVLGNDLRVEMGSADQARVMDVGLALVVVTALLSSLAGWGLLELLERFRSDGARLWAIAAVVVTVLSLSGPLVGAITVATTVALIAMHLAVAVVLVPLLVRTSGHAEGR